jgi:sorting nexin-1/2
MLSRKKHNPPTIDVCESKIQNDTIGKHHLYKVKGVDHLGDFEVYRRYKQFDLLRNVLHSRFLGLYVPPLPEKKAMGNTDDAFVQERMYFLDKFMKDIAGLPYLYESQEFATFLRPAGDLEHCFNQLPHLSTDQMLARFREVIPVNEGGADEYKIKRYNDEFINGFIRDCNVLMQALTTFRNQMKVVVPMKDQEVMYYKNFVDFLVKYEEVSSTTVANGQPPQNVDPNVSTTLLYGSWGEEMKQKLTITVCIYHS